MSDAEMFTPARRRTGLAFRPRDTASRGGLSFGPDDDGFEVLVTRKAAGDIRRATLAAAPNEAFGLLSGQSYTDERGPYTIVVGAVRARSLTCGPGHVRLSGSEMAELKADAQRANPATDVVGWWHSHSRPSGFSSVDRAEQETWPSATHVGLLAFMNGDEELVAYRGPSSRLLALDRSGLSCAPAEPKALVAGGPEARTGPSAAGRPALLVAPAPEPWRPAALQAAPPPSADGVAIDRAGDQAWWLPASLVGGLLLAVVLAVVLTVWATPGGQQSEPSPADAGWSCSVADGLTVQCSGPVGRGITGWHWRFDDGAVADGPSVDHAFKVPGSHSVSLVVATPAGSRSAGRRLVEVDAPPASPPAEGDPPTPSAAANPPPVEPGR